MPSRSIIRTGVGPHREPRNRFPAIAAAINLLAARAARVQSRRNLSRSLSPKLHPSHSITRFDRSRTGPYVASAPYVAVPVFTWTGLYVGANAGYGFLEDQHESGCGNGFSSFGSCFGGLTVQTTDGLAPVVPITGFINNFGERSSGGFVGGGQIGYNYQVTPGAGFVVGIEADIQAADLGGRERDEFFNLAGFGGVGG